MTETTLRVTRKVRAEMTLRMGYALNSVPLSPAVRNIWHAIITGQSRNGDDGLTRYGTWPVRDFREMRINGEPALTFAIHGAVAKARIFVRQLPNAEFLVQAQDETDQTGATPAAGGIQLRVGKDQLILLLDSMAHRCQHGLDSETEHTPKLAMGE